MPLPRVPFQLPPMAEHERMEASRRYLETMRRRRSVRDFAPTPVPHELVLNAVQAAALAPSGANQQPWTFVLIGDEPDLRARIRAAAEAEERESYEGRMSAEWLAALEPLGTDWRKPHLTDAPWLVVVFEQPYGMRDGQRVKHYYVRESVGIAVGLLLSALTHAGLATLTHTPSPMGFLARILERPANERPYVVIPIGYPAADATVPDITRKALDEVLVERPPR